jgi:hypothetical protein
MGCTPTNQDVKAIAQWHAMGNLVLFLRYIKAINLP